MKTVELASWLDLRAHLQPPELHAGGRGTLVVEAVVPEGCHIEAHEPPEPFLIPTVLVIGSTSGAVSVGAVRYPPASQRRLDWSPVVLEVYQGRLRFEADVDVAAAAPPGLVGLTIELRYQGCTETTCLPPMSRSVGLEVEIRPAQPYDARPGDSLHGLALPVQNRDLPAEAAAG